MKKLTDLPVHEQQLILERLREFMVFIDPKTGLKYIRHFNEDIDYNSIKNAQLLNG